VDPRRPTPRRPAPPAARLCACAPAAEFYARIARQLPAHRDVAAVLDAAMGFMHGRAGADVEHARPLLEAIVNGGATTVRAEWVLCTVGEKRLS
jgi:hypothetical protein